MIRCKVTLDLPHLVYITPPHMITRPGLITPPPASPYLKVVFALDYSQCSLDNSLLLHSLSSGLQ